MICQNCGAVLPDGTKFCSACGTEQSAPAPDPRQPACQPPAQPYAPPYAAAAPAYTPTNADRIPPEYRPLSPWAYFGYSILYSIPLIGFILMVVFALNNDNINRRNHARSMFCGLILALIFGVAAIILAAVLGIDIADEVGNII